MNEIKKYKKSRWIFNFCKFRRGLQSYKKAYLMLVESGLGVMVN